MAELAVFKNTRVSKTTTVTGPDCAASAASTQPRADAVVLKASSRAGREQITVPTRQNKSKPSCRNGTAHNVG